MQQLFLNSHFVAVDKPAGWLSVPGRTGDADPRPCAGLILQRELNGQLWPVHRLDLEVSGLLLFARDPDSHRQASRWFEGRALRKRYEAYCEGNPRGLQRGVSVEWQAKLLRGKKRAYASPRGKEAVTRATFVGESELWVHWQLEPLTSRPHQLRVQLAEHGYPIVGDVLYGASHPLATDGIALRAVALDLSGCTGHQELGLPDTLAVTPLALAELRARRAVEAR